MRQTGPENSLSLRKFARLNSRLSQEIRFSAQTHFVKVELAFHMLKPTHNIVDTLVPRNGRESRFEATSVAIMAALLAEIAELRGIDSRGSRFVLVLRLDHFRAVSICDGGRPTKIGPGPHRPDCELCLIGGLAS